MQTFEQIVYPGSNWKLIGQGRYFRLLSTVDELNIRLFNQGRVVYEAQGVEAGFYTMPDDGFDAVEVITATPQLVKLAVSDGTGGYDRYNGTVNLQTATSIVNTGAVTVNTTATLLVAANAARRGLRVLNSSSVIVYLGGAGVDLANGMLKINPGDMLFESEGPGCAWYAVAESGTATVKVQELY
jgi:hypothetical protein